MKCCAWLVWSAVLAVCVGCSAEATKRAAYESMKNKTDMDCRSRPGASCPEPKSYDDYQRDMKK